MRFMQTLGLRTRLGKDRSALQQFWEFLPVQRLAGVGHGMVYIVFPGSAQTWPLSQPDIDQYGAQLFSKWGGLDRAKDCFPDMQWS